MSEAHTPRKRSLAEWSYFIRRNHVLRAIRHPALTPAAKQVLVALSVADDDPFVLPERPPVGALSRRLALAERTVRQAITELVEQGCLTFRTTGEFFRPGEAPKPAVAPPATPPQLTQADILPTLRDIIDSDPGATAMVFEILAEIEAEAAGQPALAPPADAAMACAI